MSLHISQRFNRDGTSVTINLHDLTSANAGEGRNGHGWITFRDDTGGVVTLHVDYMLAEMLAETFSKYEDRQSGQEGPESDEAHGAAQRCVEGARALK